jgi:hypothetical protein
MKTSLSSFAGIVGMGGIAFVYFMVLFTHPISEGFSKFVIGCAFAAGLVGMVVGALARRPRKLTLILSLLPLTAVTLLLVVGGFQAGFQKNFPGIIGAVGLMVAFCVSWLLAAWIANKFARKTAQKE